MEVKEKSLENKKNTKVEPVPLLLLLVDWNRRSFSQVNVTIPDCFIQFLPLSFFFSEMTRKGKHGPVLGKINNIALVSICTYLYALCIMYINIAEQNRVFSWFTRPSKYVQRNFFKSDPTRTRRTTSTTTSRLLSKILLKETKD